MALKIAQLRDALAGGGGGDGDSRLFALLEEWQASDPVEADHWTALRERFETAARRLLAED